VSGNTAFVADRYGGLQIIDVSDLRNPLIIGSVDTPASASGVAVSGTNLLVAAGDLLTIPLSKEIFPVVVEGETEISLSLPAPFIAGFYTLTVFNETETYTLADAVIFEPQWNPGSGKFSMELHGEVWSDGNKIETDGYVIAAFGPGGDSNCRGRSDITDSGGNWGYHLTIVSDNNGEKITFKLWDSNTGQVHTIDDTISFDRHISVSKNLGAPLKLESVYPSLGVAEQNSEVRLNGSEFDENTRVLMFSDSWNRRNIIGSVDTPGEANGVALSGNTAFVADGVGGLQIIDVSDPENPNIIGSADTPGYARSVAISDDTAFVADGFEGLQIVDVGYPENPEIIGSKYTMDEVNGVSLSGDTAFLAAGYGGLQIIDVSDPRNPVTISEATTGNYALSLTISDNTAFVVEVDTSEVRFCFADHRCKRSSLPCCCRFIE